MSKCKGCGITMHTGDANMPGYTPKKDSKLCERCFKITNYNYHEKESKMIDNNVIIKGINNKKGATLFLCDILNLNSNTMELFDIINEPKVLVITKSDIIPKNIKLDILEENIKRIYGINKVLFISCLTGFGKNKILDYIYDYPRVIFAGPTSSGKSSLINYLFDKELTVSNYKNTTQEFIDLKIDNQEIIDAPGFNEEYLMDSSKQKGFINPKTMIIKKGYSLCINDFEFYSDKDINVTLFFPKNILFKTRKTRQELSRTININKYSDLVINNLGFIYFKDHATLYVCDNNYLDVRESIVGGK